MRKKEYLDVDDLKGDDRISMKDLDDLGRPGKSEKQIKKKVAKVSYGGKRLVVGKSKKSSSAYSKYLSEKEDYNLANFSRRR